MIPNILYNILRNNSSNNNSNNTENNNNPDNNPDNNADNNDSINNPNVNPNANTNNNLENNPGSRNIHVYDSNQLITPPPTLTTPNQSIFNNIRFGAPVCILRAPSDLDIPSTSTDENSSEQPPLSAIFLTPNASSSLNESVETETAKVNDKTTEGIFSDKYSLHVIPVEGNNNHLFMNRISYNTPTDAYYENGILSNKYLKTWKEGAYQWDNIEKKIEYDWMKTYLARSHTEKKMNDDGEISWKFDYRVGGFVINSLKLRLSFGTFDDSASVQWFIKPLPTMKNPNTDWHLIQFDPYTEYRHEVNEVKDVTQFVKNEYGFILKAHLSGGEKTEVIWQKTQLFRQDWNRVVAKSIDLDDNNTFGFDINVELKPDIIVDSLPGLPVSNDESTSDFVIYYEFSTGDNQDTSSSSRSDKESKVIRVHSEVLSKGSDYFKALLESRMIESQNKSLTLTDADISYDSLEIIINYLYTGTFPDIKNYDEWTTLLHDASRFLIPTLIQRCEKGLKGYLSHDNLNEIKGIANETGAEQLLQYCENFELPKIN